MKTEHHTHRSRKHSFLLVLAAQVLLVMTVGAQAQEPTGVIGPPIPANCARLIKADVVALDQAIVYNRLGTVNPNGMIYALKRDIVAIDPLKGLSAGNVRLRADKRPRPLVLRMNIGDCLKINFTNLLSKEPRSSKDPPSDDQPSTRSAGVHVIGMELVGNIKSDGSNVGTNPPSLVPPDGFTTYTFTATREGNNLMYSTGTTTGGEGDGGTLAEGLFGSVNVEPRGAEWYRSQVTAVEMAKATTGTAGATATTTIGVNVKPGGQPIIDYDRFKMLDADNNIIYSDLNAIITGPGKGRFPKETYRPNATEPDRNQPFREFTVIYHDEIQTVQAFPEFREGPLVHTLHSVQDKFAINYGTAGVGAEILANRLGVGPMFDCTECKFEEFFLSSCCLLYTSPSPRDS